MNDVTGKAPTSELLLESLRGTLQGCFLRLDRLDPIREGLRGGPSRSQLLGGSAQVSSEGGGPGGKALLLLQGSIQDTLQLGGPRLGLGRLALGHVQLSRRPLPPGGASLCTGRLRLRRSQLSPEVLNRPPEPRLDTEEPAPLPSELLGPLRNKSSEDQSSKGNKA